MTNAQLSLLSGEEVKASRIVVDGSDDLYRASTYDLSVGVIIKPGTGEKSASIVDDYELKPGGTVKVVSKELLKMPDTITAHVLLKNELCRQGILAINIGVVDPGFEGPIASTLLNFGRQDFPIKKGDPFLRVSFHRCPESPLARKSAKYSRDDYLRRVREEVQAYAAETFLNLDVATERAAQRAFGSFQQTLVVWATIAAIFLTIVAILAPLAASYAEKSIISRDQSEQRELERVIQNAIEERYDAQLKALAEQVETLQRSILAPGAMPPGDKR
jgi:deoxycytidine triphosphate deaminase